MCTERIGYSIFYLFFSLQEIQIINGVFDSLWCGMTDRCFNALKAASGMLQKRAGINSTQALSRAAASSSGSRVWTVTRRRLVPCLNGRAEREWTRSFLPLYYSFNANKHDWTSGASCNCSISVSTAEISFTSASHQCPHCSLEKWTLERSISWNITPYSHYILLNLLSLNYLMYV